MKLLALETSGPAGGIALAEAGRVVEEVRLAEGMRHGRDLVAAARDAALRAGWDRRAIDAVAVSIGPGSFTGLRIALVAAKFIAWDTGARVVAVPTLRVIAENAPADACRIVPVLDAKRGGLYASVFQRSSPGGALAETFGPALVEPEALAARLEAPAFVLGRGLRKARPALEGFDLAPETLWDPRPSVVARLGAERAEAGDFADSMTLEPLYIRRPEPEEIWERRHGG